MRRNLLWLPVVIFLLSGWTGISQPKLLERTSQLEELNFLIGQWQGTIIRFLPAGELKVSAKAGFDWALGESWLRGQEETTLPGGQIIQNLTWLVWDPQDSVIRGHWQDNVFPGAVSFEGRWVEDTLKLDSGNFVLRGRPHRVVLSLTRRSPDELAMELQMAWDGDALKTVGRGTYARVPPDGSH